MTRLRSNNDGGAVPIKHLDFMHIGKCAGNQIESLLTQISNQSDFTFTFHQHEIKLRHLDSAVPYFFSIRNPISRFFSGFYSRKRKGQPKFYNPWTSHEEKSFQYFPHANNLAESLFDHDLEGRLARNAITTIGHLRNHQIDWFEGQGEFLDLHPPVGIIRVEHFDRDLDKLLSKLDLDFSNNEIIISNNPIVMHKNDYSNAEPLSKKAKENLQQWYLRDFFFYATCEDWIIQNNFK